MIDSDMSLGTRKKSVENVEFLCRHILHYVKQLSPVRQRASSDSLPLQRHVANRGDSLART